MSRIHDRVTHKTHVKHVGGGSFKLEALFHAVTAAKANSRVQLVAVLVF